MARARLAVLTTFAFACASSNACGPLPLCNVDADCAAGVCHGGVCSPGDRGEGEGDAGEGEGDAGEGEGDAGEGEGSTGEGEGSAGEGEGSTGEGEGEG